MKMDPQYSWIIEIARLSRRGLTAIFSIKLTKPTWFTSFSPKLGGDSEFFMEFQTKNDPSKKILGGIQ